MSADTLTIRHLPVQGWRIRRFFSGLSRRSRVDRRRFVQAEISNVNHYYTTGFELGFRYRKLLTYGEYIYNNISRYIYGANNQKTDLKNAVFNGWYATASYMILGENRQYSPMRLNLVQ